MRRAELKLLCVWYDQPLYKSHERGAYSASKADFSASAASPKGVCASVFMDISTSSAITNQERVSTPASPFSPELDTELVSVILRIQELYSDGKRTFVIVTHRDPDSDAIAGCLGMDRLIRGILPGDVSITWMHDGHLCPSLQKVCGRVPESIRNLPGLLEADLNDSVAILVVDQPGLHTCAVLPNEMRFDRWVGNRDADIVLDHHGDSRHDPGILSAPESGCTAALVYRLLELAQNHERFRNTAFSKIEDEQLALLVNVGARTDAGQSVIAPLSETASPFIRWAVDKTEGRFDKNIAATFDVLGAHHSGLVEAASADAHIYHGVLIGGVLTHLAVSYAGVADNAHCIGACATRMLNLEREKQRLNSSHYPVAVVVCGLIRLDEKTSDEVVRAGERVQISIRTEPPVDAELIAQSISAAGGGRIGAAAVQLAVPENYDHVKDELYVSRLLALLEVKLTWPEKFSWNLDARS